MFHGNGLIPQDFGLPDERLTIFTELAVQLHLLTPAEKTFPYSLVWRRVFRFIHTMLHDHFGFTYALPLLNNKNAYGFAVRVLGLIRDARAIEPLLVTLHKNDEDIRDDGFADALAKIGTPAVEPLLDTLHDEDERIRSIAADALGKIGDARAIDPLIILLSDKTGLYQYVDINEDVKVTCVCDYAAEALEQIGTSAALAAVETWRTGKLSRQ
jgi:hypothetical protein